MKQGLVGKEVTMQDGTDVGKVKDVIVTLEPKDVTLVVSRGLLRGQTEIPWSQINAVEDLIVVKGDVTATEEEMAGEAETNNVGTVKILFYSDCPHVAQTTQDIKAVLDEEGLTADIQSIDLTQAPDVEQKMPYAGSPTILVNDLDIAPPGEEFTGPMRGNCRLYEFKGQSYEYPPKELIRQALTRGRRKGKAQAIPTGQPREREGEITRAGAMPAAPEHDLDYHEAPSSSTSMPSEGSRTGMPQESAPGTMPAAPEHDVDYHREEEAAQQPQRSEQTKPLTTKGIGTIQVLYYTDCPHYVQTKWDIESILSESGLKTDVQLIDLAQAPDVGKKMPYAGSPTILVNGKDIAPAGDEFAGPQKGTCRLYDYKGEVYDYPPKELIREALTKGRLGGEK